MKTLLIADDQPGVRSLVRMTLEHDDYEIIEAANGLEALRLIRARSPDLVLLDVMMPVMNGFDVCRAVKSDPLTASTTIIMLTAKAQDGDRAQGQAAGADDFIAKPFSPLSLMDKVGSILRVAS